MSDILPCPWCGGNSVETSPNNEEQDEWFTVCPNHSCDAMGPSQPTETDAIAAWNQVAAMPAELERLRAELDRCKGVLIQSLPDNK